MSENREVKPFQNPDLVVLRNPVARAKFGLSLIQQKFLFEVFAFFKDRPADRLARFNIREYFGRLGISTNNLKEYVREVEEMRKFDIKIPTGDNEKGVNFIGVTLFASVEYRVGEDRNGYIEVEVSDKLKPYFLEIAKGDFFYYHIANTRVLKSIYSIKLYLLLKSYAWRGKLEVGLDELKDILELDNSQYKQYPDFRKRVLDRAREEMTEKNDITFDYEEVRAIAGNSKSLVVKIKFRIYDNPNVKRTPVRIEMPGGEPKEISEHIDLETKTAKPKEKPTKNAREAVARDSDLDKNVAAMFRKFDPESSEEFMLDYAYGLGYSLEKILDGLFYAEQQGNVKNIFAYLPVILKGRAGEGMAEKAQRKRDALKKAEAEKRRLTALAKEYSQLLDKLDSIKRNIVRQIVGENPTATESVVAQIKSRYSGQFGIHEHITIDAFRENPFLRSLVIQEFRVLFPDIFGGQNGLREAEDRLAEVKKEAKEIDPNYVL